MAIANRGSGFSTIVSDNPAWFIDLYNHVKIKTILLYETSGDSAVNARPLIVALSDDNKKWRTVYSIVSPAINDNPTTIILEMPEPGSLYSDNGLREI